MSERWFAILAVVVISCFTVAAVAVIAVAIELIVNFSTAI